MINKFLKAKHWQLFFLMIGLPLLLQFVTMGLIMLNVSTGGNPEQTIMISMLTLFSITMIIHSGLFFGWFWSIAIGLQVKMPPSVKMKVKKFKTFFFVPLAYIVLISVFIGVSLGGLLATEKGTNSELMGVFVSSGLILHLFSMFCIFYSLYFVSKTIKTVELQREVNFGEFIGEFFMIWFYPIGIWIIQPKINKMVEEELKV